MANAKNIQIFISFYIIYSFLKLFMMKEYKRFRSSNFSEKKLRPKLFHRRDTDPKAEDLYQQGVEEIIKLKKFFEMTDQTILLAIDIYKNFLKSIKSNLRGDKVATYMACIYIAGKLNQVYPPQIEMIVEGCENIAGKKKILRMESIICRVAHFDFPLTDHLSRHFNSILGEDREQEIRQCLEESLKTICDANMMEIDNQSFAKAIVSVLFPEIGNHKKIDKESIRLVFKIKRKLNLNLAPSGISSKI